MSADIQKKTRTIWLDVARTLGIMLVVGCHAVETYYRPVLLGKAEITLLPWIVEHVLFTAGTAWCSPFSGYQWGSRFEERVSGKGLL